jgi:hypothetical protein
MRGVLRARTQMEDGKQLRRGVDDQPQPQDAGMAAQPCANFIQLQVWEVQMAEGPLVQRLSMLACTREPPRDGRLTGAEDTLSRRSVQSFGKPRRAPWRPGTRRRFQAIQGRGAPGT